MEDYEKELLNDLGSDSEDENQLEETKEKEERQSNGSQLQQQTFEDKLYNLLNKNSVNESYEGILNRMDIDNFGDLTKLSKILPIIPELKSRIELYSNEVDSDYLELLSSVNQDNRTDEYKFILNINELSTIINNEISMFHSLVKLQYKIVFPELETLVLNSIDYSKVILLIKQDLINIKNYEIQLKEFISSEKVLVIIMAGLQSVKQQFILSDEDLNKALKCCGLILQLNDILVQLSQFISNKLSKFAPNVAAIVGPITTSQLLIATGSLRQLSLTPSCNLPSLGVTDLSSQTRTKSRNIRQTGYLYHSDLIKYLPEDIMRSVMRIVSGKVILAARIDLGKSCLNGEIGYKYLEEIKSKIDKLLTPPEHQVDKALPIPAEQKSKKRGGRRSRKMKERFQMSELRKAQNKMEFGKQEDTIIDSYGEEIGLGMSRSNGINGRINNIKLNPNTSAKMSKAMVSRLQSQKKSSANLMNDDFESIILSNPSKSTTSFSKALPTSSNNNKWFNGMIKRKMDTNETDESSNTKRQHI